MKLNGLPLALGFAALAAVPAYGQVSTTAQAASNSTSPSTKAPADTAAGGELTDVIVTARRTAERLQDVPITVQVETSEQLDRVGVVDTRGLELLTPGLTMQQQSGFLQPALRGVTTTIAGPGADNPIAIYLDGVYVSSQAGSIISLPDVARVEVDKGPQGTLFGRNATGGAIQIFTKDPGFTPTGSVSVIGGYFDGGGQSLGAYDLGFRGFVSGPVIPGLLAASVSFSEQRTDGYVRNIAYGVSQDVDLAYGGNREGANEDEVVRGKILFTPTDNLKILATGYYTYHDGNQSNAGYIVAGQSSALAYPDHITATQPWTTSYDYPRPDDRGQGDGASIKVDWALDFGTVTSISAWSRVREDEWVDTDMSYSPDCLAVYACIGVRDEFVDTDLQQELVFSSHKFSGFSFVAGGFAYRGSSYLDVGVDECGLGCQPAAGLVVLQPVLEYDELIVSHSYGIFGEGNYDITDRLTATVGARESYESKRGTIQLPSTTPSVLVANPNWNAFTPRLSLRFALDPASNVYATYSEGFKSGVIADGSATATPAAPEKLYAYEVGYKIAEPTFDFNAAAFYYKYKDMQVQSNAGLGGALTIVNNAASSKIYGLDLDGTVKLTHDLSVHGGISWLPHANFQNYPNAVGTLPVASPPYAAGTTVIDLSGSRLYKTPKVTTDLSLLYEKTVSSGTVSFSPNVYYASEQFFEATHLIHPNDVRVGAEAGYKPKGSNFRYSLWVKNLTNAHAPIQNSLDNNGFTLSAEPPREIGLTATFDF
jgi:iron complex outermembrane receptor protein